MVLNPIERRNLSGLRSSCTSAAIFIMAILVLFTSHGPTWLDSILSVSVQESVEITDHCGGTNEVPTSVSDRSDQYSWNMFRYDEAHSGFIDGVNAPETNNILWTFNTSNSNTGNGIFSSAAIVEGKVYIGSGEGKLYCLNLTTGAHYWNYSTRGGSFSHGQSCSPAISGGKVYIGNDFRPQLWCIDADTGLKIWNFSTGGVGMTGIYSSPTVVDGKVIFGTDNNKVFCLPEDDPNGDGSISMGEIIWKYDAPDKVWSSPAVEGNRVFFGCGDANSIGANKLYCISLNDGSVDWTFPSVGNVTDVVSSPAVADGKVYFGAKDNNVYALYANNGTEAWNYPTGGYVISSPAVAYGRIFIGSDDNKIHCLNATTGSSIWDYTTGGDIWSSPTVADEKVYIGSCDGKVYCLSATADGAQKVWEYQITSVPYGICSSPAIIDGKMIIGGTDPSVPKVHCFADVDTIPPTVKGTFPEDGSNDVPTTVTIRVDFSEEMDASSISGNILLRDSTNNTVIGVMDYDEETYSATFSPDAVLLRNETYAVKVLGSLTDSAGLGLDGNNNTLVEGSPMDDYSWEFNTTENLPPLLTEGNISSVEGDLITDFEFSVVYTDPDNDTPIAAPGYIKTYLDEESAGRAMSLDNNAPSHLRDGNYSNGERYLYSTRFSTYGEHSFHFGCSDGINVYSTSVRHEPLVWFPQELDVIPDQTATEDIDLILDLTGKIMDEDTNITDLIPTVNSSFAVIEDLIITFNYPNSFNYPGGRTNEMVRIGLFDPVMDYNVTRTFRVNVMPVNDGPRISEVQDIFVKEDVDFILDMAPYISDEDNEKSDLFILTNSSYATINGKKIIFHYPLQGGAKSEPVSIMVFDGELYGYMNITVSVIPEGAPFVLLSIPDQHAVEDVDLILNITDYIELFWNASITDIKLDIASIHAVKAGTRLVFNYPNSFNYPGGRTYEIVRINVSYLDYQYKDSWNFRVNVQPVNDGPRLTVIDPPRLGYESIQTLFRVKYMDVDGGEAPQVVLVFNGTIYNMSLKSGDIHIGGAIYGWDLELFEGEYLYHFRVNDLRNATNSINTSKEYNLTVIEYDQPSDDDDTKGAMDKRRGSAVFIWLLIILVAVIAGVMLFIFFFLKSRRDEEEDEDPEETEDPGPVSKRQLINDIVDQEDERERILDKIDRITGKIEQLEWDLEDGHLTRGDFLRIKDGYRNRIDIWERELDRIHDKIDDLEMRIEREERRRISRRRMYGGRGSEDFHRPSYGETEVEFREDPVLQWDVDEYDDVFEDEYGDDDEDEYDDEFEYGDETRNNGYGRVERYGYDY